MRTESPLVVFRIDRQRYAVFLENVRRVFRAMAVTPLPGVSPIVLGIIDVGGEIIPVIDIRKRFGHQLRQIRLSDHFLLAVAGGRTVALLVDVVIGVLSDRGDSIAPSAGILPAMELVEGVVKCEDGLILIHDLERLLSLDDISALERGLHLVNDARAESGGTP